jgi:WD40 repeat protein/mono/diheme cytochrome c family protein
MRLFGPLAGVNLALAVFALTPLHAAEVSYSRDIRPILQRQCQGCHQPNLKTSNLDLTTYEGLRAGGKRGAAFMAGAPDQSPLLKYITGDLKPQMPVGQPPLAPEQIELVRGWIAAGAKDDTPAEARETISLDKPISYSQPPVITALAYSPDGSTLAVSAYREILLLPANKDLPSKRLPGMSERIQSIAFSADGSTLIGAGGTPARFGEVQVWDVNKGNLARSITVTGDTVFGGSLSPDGSKIGIGCADNTVRIFETASGKELYKIGNHENWVLATVFSVDGKRIVSVGRDRAAKLTDANTGAFLENINLLRGELSAVARHPAKDVVVIGGEDRIPYVYIMDRPKNMKIADDTTLIRQFERQNGAIMALAWSPDAKQIAVAGAAPEVNLYDAETGKKIAAVKGHTAGIYALAYTPDSKQIATGGFDGKVRIYDSSSGTLVREFVPVPLETSSVRSPQQ